jgi:plasmid stability protein
MPDVLVRDLDSQVLERLKTRARQHGRSLQGEIKAILEAVAPLSMSEARRLAEQWQQRLAGQIQGDSSELLGEDRKR